MTAKPLSEWLQVMVEEIARKRLDAERAATEQCTGADEAGPAATPRRPGAAPASRS